MNLNNAQRTPTSTQQAAIGTNEFLAFKLGDEEYGVDILRVQEIRSYEQPTHMVNTPDHILGVVNLRGVIVPIIDMRIQFGLREVKYNDFTVVIVLNIGEKVVGMVVDAVSDVITLTPEQLRPAPDIAGTIDSSAVLALGTVNDRMLILLDIEKVMGNSDTGLIAQAA
ncbi:chemotaxis protein CheW [Hylemonella gracilis str. Niagara R]|uniref:Chemotaxis protein CheW n=1 Tax=Hylemonella gracilis str. Niagara R TaxID=1458275 RepID=A0A016XKT6_9BURK|nr:chemotaxis protein CheW [Hylemonella gracilis]EYC52704.1 chemotaxis protein CheW [Hylemonella gracilis str. Niagara R]